MRCREIPEFLAEKEKKNEETDNEKIADCLVDLSMCFSNVIILVNGTDDKGLPFSTEVSTNSSGVYCIENIPYGTYSLTVQKEGYKNNYANVTVTYDNQVVNNLYLISENSSGVGSATGYVYNAQNAYGISGITIYVRSGSNVTTGDIVMKLTSGASGYYSIEALEAGNYTLQFVDERGTGNEFANNSINVSILADSCATDQNVTLSLKAASNVIRVVLTWGASPSDLDSHMLFGGSHVYYRSKNVGNVSLDVDDTSSYGPETITINGVKEGTTYHYYVYNYSKGGNRVLSNSGARVTVYVGDEIKYEFSVPTGSGLYWDVFTYSVENGFTIINTIKTSI